VTLRRESKTSGCVPIAIQHIESITRLSEVHDKKYLRKYAHEYDIDARIGMMMHSFITAQKN